MYCSVQALNDSANTRDATEVPPSRSVSPEPSVPASSDTLRASASPRPVNEDAEVHVKDDNAKEDVNQPVNESATPSAPTPKLPQKRGRRGAKAEQSKHYMVGDDFIVIPDGHMPHGVC